MAHTTLRSPATIDRTRPNTTAFEAPHTTLDHRPRAQLRQNAAFMAQRIASRGAAVQRKAPIEGTHGTSLGGHMPTRSGLDPTLLAGLTIRTGGAHGFEYAGLKFSARFALKATLLDVFSFKDHNVLGGSVYVSGTLNIFLEDEHRAAELILGAGAEAHVGTPDDGGATVGWGRDQYFMRPLTAGGLNFSHADQGVASVAVAGHYAGHTAYFKAGNDTKLIGGDGGDRHRTAHHQLGWHNARSPGRRVDGLRLNNNIVTGAVDNAPERRHDPQNVTPPSPDHPRGVYRTQPGPFRNLSKGTLTLQGDFTLDGHALSIEAGADSERIRDRAQNKIAHKFFDLPDVSLVEQAAQFILRVSYGRGAR